MAPKQKGSSRPKKLFASFLLCLPIALLIFQAFKPAPKIISPKEGVKNNNNNNNKEKNSNNKKKNKKKNDRVVGNKPHAYIHIGPPKTGSTTLENTMYKLRNVLRSDSYVQPDDEDAPGGFRAQGLSANLAVCLCKYGDRVCHSDLLDTHFPAFLESARNQSQNILLSSEFFYTDRCDFDRMAKLFQGFDVTILVVYRQFHGWFKSVHYQSAVSKVKSGSSITPVVRFASEPNVDANEKRYATYQRYEKTFGSQSIKVVDMDSAFKGEGLVDVFFCHYLVPKPEKTCEKIRQTRSFVSRNTAIPADYMALADEAKNKGLFQVENTTLPRWAVNKCLAEKVQDWWEIENNKTLADLPRSCISEEQFEFLKKTTIKIHEEFAPYIDTNVSIPELEASVEKKRSDYCSVEIPTILSTPRWKKMLASLTVDCE